MGKLNKDTFICIDCESTGLDTDNDRIIEIAAVKFTFDGVIASMETLVNPEKPIPEDSTKIHHITNDMVKGKPTIKEVLKDYLDFAKDIPIVGHGIGFDINIITSEAERAGIYSELKKQPSIDTLRLARLYGESAINSLEALRSHFNIPAQGAHRAMNDVMVNIEVFKFLTNNFATTEKMLHRLKKPIALKTMPLGKHKGRIYQDIPIEYLRWAAAQNFDQDLLFSLRSEINRRKKSTGFRESSNPFSSL